MRPRVDGRLRRGAAWKRQANAGHGDQQGSDRTERGPRDRIEALEGLREAPASLSFDRADQFAGSLRVGLLDLVLRPIEVAEDPTDLFIESAEALGPKSVDRLPASFPQRLGPDAVGGLEVAVHFGRRDREEIRIGGDIVRLPCTLRRGRDGNSMERFPLLVGREGHPEGEEEDRAALLGLHTRTDPRRRSQARDG
ncbi:MAG: hypothetical protein E6K19_08650 [Methanobacteriota archaeon]|nr:MAG: hypothetical protein E6K19_08650 [Euryarchaeota archaeon]